MAVRAEDRQGEWPGDRTSQSRAGGRRPADVALTRAKDALNRAVWRSSRRLTTPENGEETATTHDGDDEMRAAQAALDAAITSEAIGGMDVPEPFDPGSKWDYRPVLNQFINGSHKDESDALSRLEKRAAVRKLVGSVETGGPRHVTSADEFVLMHADGDLKAAAAEAGPQQTLQLWDHHEQRYLDADKAPGGGTGDTSAGSGRPIPEGLHRDRSSRDERSQDVSFLEDQAAAIRKASNTQGARTSKVYGADRGNWPAGSLHTVTRGEEKAAKAEQAVESLKQAIREDDEWVAADRARSGVTLTADLPVRGQLRQSSDPTDDARLVSATAGRRRSTRHAEGPFRADGGSIVVTESSIAENPYYGKAGGGFRQGRNRALRAVLSRCTERTRARPETSP